MDDLLSCNRKMRKNYKKISYRLHLIHSARFMTSSLSNLVNNLAEGIQKTKCEYDHDNQPRPKSNFKKLALAPHDFAVNFYLI